MPAHDTFASTIAYYALTREGLSIPNAYPHHARYMIKKLFDIADVEVRLFSGHLTLRTLEGIEIYAWASLIQSAQDFLRRGRNRLAILVENRIDQGSSNTFLKALADDEERIGTISLIIPKPTALSGMSNHFLVADRTAYRLEVDQHQRTAVGNFNDPEVAQQLKTTFDKMCAYLRARSLCLYDALLQPGDKFGPLNATEEADHVPA